MKTTIYDSVSDIEDQWKKYFQNGSLMGNFPLACFIEKNLFKFCTKEVKVVVFSEDDEEVKGILPINFEEREGKAFWGYYPGSIFTASEITVAPCCWPHFDKLPQPFILEETSWISVENAKGFLPPWVQLKPSNVIHLDKPFPDYFLSLEKKARSTLKNIINKNEDIRVEAKEPEREAFAKIEKMYFDYCVENFTEDLQCQLYMFPEIFKTASRLGKLVALSFYLEERLVAANYGILNDRGNSFSDYICYRNCEDTDLRKRSLGIYAIIENIKYIQELGCEWYDLASDFDYKKQFVNCEKFHVIS